MATASRTYNPQTGTWTKNKSSNKGTGKTTSKTNSSGGSSSKSGSGSGGSSSIGSKNSSSSKTTKKLKQITLRTLEGTINYIATKETIKLKPGDTVQLKGLGKNLSGKYYVKEVTRSISTSGYTQTATVIKSAAGTSLKTKTIKAAKRKKYLAGSKKYKVKKGDTLASISKKAYGATVLADKIYKDNKKKIPNKKKLKVGTQLTIAKPTDKEQSKVSLALYKKYPHVKNKKIKTLFGIITLNVRSA